MILGLIGPDGAEAATSAMSQPWWSFTKTILAAAALRLVDQGRLALDMAMDGATLRQLLRHQAGLPDYGDVPAYHAAVAAGEAPWPRARMRAASGPPLWAPGAGWKYSNIGYLLVRDAIERATGETLGAALARLVLAPAGAVRTRLALGPGDLADVGFPPPRPYDPGWVYHGLLVGPALDAARTLRAILAPGLLSASARAAMRDAIDLGGAVPDRPWSRCAYGLGLMAGAFAGDAAVLGHSGAGPFSVAAVYHHLTSGRTVAVFAPGDKEGVAEWAVTARITSGDPAPSGGR